MPQLEIWQLKLNDKATTQSGQFDDYPMIANFAPSLNHQKTCGQTDKWRKCGKNTKAKAL